MATALTMMGCAPVERLAQCPPEPPDLVVMVVVDTVRADYLGSYGFDGPISPNLDALAARSVQFDAAIAPAPWTKPSVASLFTGVEAQRHGVSDHQGKFRQRPEDTDRLGVLGSQWRTLAEVMSEAGYTATAFVGNPWLASGMGFEQGFSVYRDEFARLDLPAATLLGEFEASSLASPVGSQFVYLHLMDAHGPYVASDELVAAVRASPSLDDLPGVERTIGDEALASMPRYLREPAWVTGAAARSRREWRVRYAAGVRQADRAIGRLVEWLDRHPRGDDSLLIVTSDHGEELGDHGGWDHGDNLFDHQLRVPLLVKLPGDRGAGSRLDSWVGLIDLLPTLQVMLGDQPMAGGDGRSLWPYLCGSPRPPAGRSVLSTATKRRPGAFALHAGGFVFHHDVGSGTSRLFDLEADPRQLVDVVASHPDVVAEWTPRMLAAARLGDLAALAVDSVELDDETRRQLESLGYLQ